MDIQAKKFLEHVKNNPVLFGRACGFEDLGDIHNTWIKNFILRDEDQTLQAHRGSFKTTCLSVAIAIMIIVLPHKNMLFIRKADDDVKEIVLQVGKMLEKPPFHALAYNIFKKKLVKIKESVFEIDTNIKQTSRGTSQLVGMGSRGSMTGKHADIIITDDIVNIDDRISKAHREKTKYVYQELQNIKNRGGRFINTGTPWHTEDAFKLMPNIERYDCYSTGMINDSQLNKIRKNMSPSLFCANYELKHIADSEALFKAPNIDDGSNTELIYDGICHIDAAYDGEDWSAFTIIKERGDKIYVYGDAYRRHIDDCLQIFENMREHFRAGTVFNEINADKGYLAKKIKKPVKTYHEKMNKYVKISTYLRERWNDLIFINETSREYINQILDYTENAEHDDAPDSLASILREIKTRNKIEVIRGVRI
jgi:hypothetical protein